MWSFDAKLTRAHAGRGAHAGAGFAAGSRPGRKARGQPVAQHPLSGRKLLPKLPGMLCGTCAEWQRMPLCGPREQRRTLAGTWLARASRSRSGCRTPAAGRAPDAFAAAPCRSTSSRPCTASTSTRSTASSATRSAATPPRTSPRPRSSASSARGTASTRRARASRHGSSPSPATCSSTISAGQRHRNGPSLDEHPEIVDSIVSAQDPLAQAASVEGVKAWLSQLRPREREVVALRYCADLSVAEIADCMQHHSRQRASDLLACPAPAARDGRPGHRATRAPRRGNGMSQSMRRRPDVNDSEGAAPGRAAAGRRVAVRPSAVTVTIGSRRTRHCVTLTHRRPASAPVVPPVPSGRTPAMLRISIAAANAPTPPTATTRRCARRGAGRHDGRRRVLRESTSDASRSCVNARPGLGTGPAQQLFHVGQGGPTVRHLRMAGPRL